VDGEAMNWSSVLPLIAAYTPAMLPLAGGLYVNNKRFDDLRDAIKDSRAEMNRQFATVNRQFDDARLKHLEER
jgi:hypothetical protein